MPVRILFLQRTHTEGQWPLSGVHSIMTVNSAQPGVGGGARLLPFTLSTITSKVVVYAPAERTDTLPPISTLPFYVLCGYSSQEVTTIFRMGL
jgi:hypothetical protein